MVELSALSTGDIIGIAAIFVGAAMAWLILFCAIFVRALGTENGIHDIRKAYEVSQTTKKWARFQTGISGFLNWITHFYGFEDADGKPQSRFKPWQRSYQLALIYPLVCLLGGYVFFEVYSLAGYDLFAPEPSMWKRLFNSVLIATPGGGLFLFLKFKLDEQFTAKLVKTFPPLKLFQDVIESIVVFSIIAVAGAVAGAVAFSVAGAVAVAVAGAGAVAVAGAGAGAGAGAVAFASAFAGLVSVLIFAQINDLPIVFFAFFFLFPLANSLMDWLSVSVTRRFILAWARNDGEMRIERYIVLSLVDFTIAIGCMLVLSALFSLGFSVLNLFIEDPAQHVPWMDQMRDFQGDPFGAGFLVTGMLFSTLVPTVCHLVAGTAAAMTMPHVGRRMILKQTANGVPFVGTRVWLGLIMSIQWLIPGIIWLMLVVSLLRFALPLSDLIFAVADYTWTHVPWG